MGEFTSKLIVIFPSTRQTLTCRVHFMSTLSTLISRLLSLLLLTSMIATTIGIVIVNNAAIVECLNY